MTRQQGGGDEPGS